MVSKSSKKKSTKRNAKKPVPAKLDLFGPPPLTGGEDRAVFDAMLLRVTEDVKPRGYVEEIWVRDFVDHTWEILRLRRAKTALLSDRQRTALLPSLSRLCGFESAKEILDSWAKGETTYLEYIDTALAVTGSTTDAVLGESLVSIIKQFDRIDALIMNKEARRNAVLREVHLHRAALALALRNAAEIQDAEFVVKEPIQLAPRADDKTEALDAAFDVTVDEGETESIEAEMDDADADVSVAPDDVAEEDESENYSEAAE